MPVAKLLPKKGNAPARISWAEEGSGHVPFWRCGVLLLLTLAVFIAYWVNPPLNLPQGAGVVMTLPDVVAVPLPDRPDAEFHGFDAKISEGELGILPSDTEFARKQYEDIIGRNSILCTVLLSGFEQRSIHRAEVCLPAQGWSITGQNDVSIPMVSGHQLVVRNLSMQRDIVNQDNEHRTLRAYFMYWFVGGDLTTSSQFMRVFMSSWDRIVHNRAYRWAYVMVMSPITSSIRPDGLNDEQTKAMMIDFIRRTAPTFQKSEMPTQAAR